MAMAGNFMHLLNGDSVAETLRHGDVPGTLSVWADVLCEGPLPRGTTPAGWREIRAAYLARAGYSSEADALARLEQWDAGLERAGEFDEIVLWLEADLFDQVLLARHLAWFGARPEIAGRLSLICIDRFPGVTPFHGLGQLDAGQLASLMPGRTRVTPTQLEAGRIAWDAFTAETPEPLDRLRAEPSPDLPFMAPAIGRYLEEYPAVTTGLGRTERTVLDELAHEGPAVPAGLFRAVQNREERPFMGDTSFWRVVRGLAGGSAPLLEIHPAQGGQGGLPAGQVLITDRGRTVLSGWSDWIEQTGGDRWYGGVHLEGRSVPWRWDPSAGRIVPA